MQSDQLIIVAGTVCAGVALLAWARRWWANRRLRVVAPSCASCLHSVEHAPSLTCPSCGADLRRAGILTPHLRAARPAGALERAGIWTCAMLVLYVALVLLLTQFPGLWQASQTRRHVLRSDAGLFDRLDVVSRSALGRGGLSVQELSISVRDTRFLASPIRADVGHATPWTYRDAGGATVRLSTELSRDDLRRWLGDGGITVHSPQQESEIGELAGLIDDVRHHPESTNVALLHLRGVANHSEASTEPIEPFRLATIIIPLVLWAAGVLLLRRHARRRRRLGAIPATAPPTPGSR